MKLLVSTKKTQGFRDSDFCFVPEGQIVMFGSECDDKIEDFEEMEGRKIDPEEFIDGCCGCHRSMMGISNLKSTTTMMVQDVDITIEELREMVKETYEKAGLASNMGEDGPPWKAQWTYEGYIILADD